MKSEKGVTLLVLVIYVLIFSIVMGILANLSSYIYGNLKYVNDNSIDVSEFNKFNTYFIKNVKSNKDAKVNNTTNGIQIIFEDGDIYEYITNEKSIYKNKQKIAKNIKSFTAQRLVQSINNKYYLDISIDVGASDNTSYTKTIKYVLKYW